MIIKKVLLDRKRYSLVEDDYCHNSNIFTIIVGSNGKGKSRLLKRIVNNIKNAEFEGEKVPNNYSRQVDVDFLGRYLSLYSSPSESKSFFSINKPNIEFINEQLNVISVTTTPFDKFPVEYRGNYLYRYHD